MRLYHRSQPFHLAAAAFAAATALPAPVPAAAQEVHGQDVHGRVVDVETGQPLPGTLVRIPTLRRSEISHGDGSFHLENLPAGEHVLVAQRIGYRTAETVVRLTSRGLDDLVIRMETTPLSLRELTVTASVGARSASSSLRPVDALANRELMRKLDATVAATLETQPGVAVTSMGPATARPVIRGLSGDRVLLLQDGERTGDLSAGSSDHAAAMDPLAARSLEVVRGPAALLYGSNALGGVVNVIKEEVPTTVPDRPTGTWSLEAGSVNRSLAGGGSITAGVGRNVAVRGEATLRDAGDLRTPQGELDNTSVSLLDVAAGASLVGERGLLGGSYRFYRNHYGIPGGFVGAHQDGVGIEMRRHQFRVEGEAREGVGPVEPIDVTGTFTDYAHEEIEAGGVLGTAFRAQTVTGEVRARHADLGPLHSGAFGIRMQGEDQRFGGSLATPDSRESSVGVYAIEEMRFGRVTLEGGVRYDRHRAWPDEADPDADIGHVRARTFGAFSGSLGLLLETEAGLVVGGSVSRAFRTPGISELYSEGPHLAAYSFEVGDPDLEEETGLGVEAVLRVVRPSGRAEIALFRNAIDGYLFPRNTGEISPTGVPVYQFAGADALLRGIEGAFEWNPAGAAVLDGTASYVHAELTDVGEPIPLIPPLQGALEARWDPTSWFVGLRVRASDRQDRVGEFETPTAGYAVFEASAGLRTTWGGRLHAFTVRASNLFDTTYRNHLSRTKEVMPEAGRGLSLLYRVAF